MKIVDPNRVEVLFRDCLAHTAEGAIIVDTVAAKLAIDPAKIEEHKIEINQMLDLMDDGYKPGGGGRHVSHQRLSGSARPAVDRDADPDDRAIRSRRGHGAGSPMLPARHVAHPAGLDALLSD